MGELTCSKRGCDNRIEYYHIGEGDYYCEGCAYYHFKVSEFVKIGSAEIIKLMTELSKNLLDKVQDYTKKKIWLTTGEKHLINTRSFMKSLTRLK